MGVLNRSCLVHRDQAEYVTRPSPRSIKPNMRTARLSRQPASASSPVVNGFRSLMVRPIFTAPVHATCRLSGHAALLSRHRLPERHWACLSGAGVPRQIDWPVKSPQPAVRSHTPHSSSREAESPFSFSAREYIIQRMNRRWTNEHERELLELRATGLTWRAIAKKVGRSEASVVTRVAIMKARIDRETKDDADFRAASLSPLELSHG
jgi:hypothetical protein